MAKATSQSPSAGSMNCPPLKVALWSIRKFMETEPIETLGFLHELEVSEVELAGFYDWAPAEMAQQLSENRLAVCSIHGPDIVKGRSTSSYLDWAKPKLRQFGTNTLCLETWPGAFSNLAADQIPVVYDELVHTLLDIAKEFEPQGVRVSYHCYDHDFRLYNQKRLLTRLLDLKRPRNLGLQVDTYWYACAGVSVEEILRWDITIHSVHLNTRGSNGECRVLDGHTKGQCETYMRAFLSLGEPIDWILENDPVEDRYPDEGSNAKQLLRECITSWPEAWKALCRPDGESGACQ